MPLIVGVVYLKHFFEGGYIFLFQFAIALHWHFKEKLLAAKDHAEVTGTGLRAAQRPQRGGGACERVIPPPPTCTRSK